MFSAEQLEAAGAYQVVPNLKDADAILGLLIDA
jgi:hypothetical protein